MINELYYVTSNYSKYELIKNYLAQYHVVVQNSALDFSEEQTFDLKKIAMAKAEHAWSLVQKPLLVDDCGFYFSHYHQFPGVLSKFVFQGLGYEGLYRLYDDGDQATFESCVVFVDALGTLYPYHGVVSGRLVKPNNTTASNEIAYANLFIPDRTLLSLAELINKHGYSEFDPRVHALQQFVKEHISIG
ncbi:hypothetical protein Noda2021_01660 [Candidatus Dependentiae bacterium Noda2021]|nr:hypothetical protein Noda2021_01660 [Candidatus Dependentiae bacterium Noda2021]